jgi:hypothetical protein
MLDFMAELGPANLTLKISENSVRQRQEDFRDRHMATLQPVSKHSL